MCLSSCSSVSFVSGDSIPVTITSSQGGDKDYIRVQRVHEDILWGLFPAHTKYDLSSIYAKFNITELGNISIEKSQSFSEQILMYLSFGIYIPSTVTYHAWVKYKR